MENNKRIKVLHIISGYGGGISSHIRNLAKCVDSEKISFDVAGFSEYNEDFINEIHNIGGRVFTFPRPRMEGYSKFIKDIIQIMKNYGPYDMVQCHISGYRAIIFRLLCSYSGINRMVIHAHSTSNESKKGIMSKFEEKINQRVNKLIATQMASCSTEASLFAFGRSVLREGKVMHLPNSIPPEKYMVNLDTTQKIKLKKDNNIPDNTFVIGHVGRFNHPKNHMFMVEIIKRMVQKKIDFVWLFIGTGELENDVRDRIQQENLVSHVKFMGRREDVNFLYQIMDVLVLPSFNEGLPTVIVEAQAAGIPSVISANITREADMGMGMVRYVSLDENIDYWINSLIELSSIQIPSLEKRKEILNLKGFSNQSAATLYEDFVFGRKKSFSFIEA